MSMAFSPKGDLFLTAGHDGKVQAWDTFTWKQAFSVTAGSGQATCVGVSADGKYLAAGCSDGTVRLWDLKAGKEPRALNESHGCVTCMALLPDGNTVVTGSADRTLRWWDVKSSDLVRQVTLPQWVLSVSVNPKGDRLLVSCMDGQVRLFDTASGKEVTPWPAERLETDFVRGPVLFLGDREWATSRFDGTVRTHAGPDGKVVQTLKGFKPHPGALAVSPDGRRLAAASYIEQNNQGVIRLWDRHTCEELGQATLTAPRVNAQSFSPGGDVLAAVCFPEQMVRLFDGRTCRELRRMEVKEATAQVGLWALAFTLDGKRLLTGGQDGRVRLWDVASGNVSRVFVGHQGGVLTVAVSPDGRTALSSGFDGTVLVWDLSR
jgi:WD40 repeat protein